MENTTEIMEELNTEIEMDELIDLIEYICLRGVIGASVVSKNLVLNEYEDAR